jgi:hypothetical protein
MLVLVLGGLRPKRSTEQGRPQETNGDRTHRARHRRSSISRERVAILAAGDRNQILSVRDGELEKLGQRGIGNRDSILIRRSGSLAAVVGGTPSAMSEA